MKPIPLAAPDGRIYAYACGRCHNVWAGANTLGYPEKGPIDGLVKSSLRDAEGCCLCECGKPARPGLWGTCEKCGEKRKQEMAARESEAENLPLCASCAGSGEVTCPACDGRGSATGADTNGGE